MQKYKLLELNKIIEERIGSLKEEVEIATIVKLNPLYIIDRKDEIESLVWTTRIIRWVLDQAINGWQQLGVSQIRLELEDTKKFENMLHEKIQELEIELEDSNTAREKEVLVNEIDTLRCVLGHLFNLKPDDDEIRAIELLLESRLISWGSDYVVRLVVTYDRCMISFVYVCILGDIKTFEQVVYINLSFINVNNVTYNVSNGFTCNVSRDKTLKWFQCFTRKSVQYDLNPRCSTHGLSRITIF